MVEVSVSILGIEEKNAIKTFYELETSKVDYFHIDVMDGKFVENNTVDKMLKYCEYLKNITNVPLDVHLMVEDIKSYINSFLAFEPNSITFHLEACKDKKQVKEYIDYIKENHCKVGLSIKPNTKIEQIEEFLPFLHFLLVMTVEPGKGGQTILTQTIEKIERLKEKIQRQDLEVQIEADGGINLETVKLVKEAGVDIIVSGNGILKTENFKETIKKLKEE